jgi:4a-hydroxytetrahydrobiopterin dehydratase
MWHQIDHSDGSSELVRSFEFSDFREAFAFCTKVAMVAEKHNHHPEINIAYNKVTVSTSTHDSGNKITEKDNKLASDIDKLQL